MYIYIYIYIYIHIYIYTYIYMRVHVHVGESGHMCGFIMSRTCKSCDVLMCMRMHRAAHMYGSRRT